MNLKIITIVILSASACSASNPRANSELNTSTISGRNNDLSKLTRAAFKKLPDKEKEKYFEMADTRVKLLDANTPEGQRFLDMPVHNRELSEIIRSEDSLWGDTVLEGDVVLTGPIKVSSQNLLIINGELFGFQLFMEASAVATFDSDCRELPSGEWSEECPVGRVSVVKIFDYAYEHIDDGSVAEEDF
ncbi:MAG: hypothetical protein NT027_14555 [Proteobacteria bacterium]|nr:hypothetical protein [Pseudomonadota bacterium]